MHHPFYISVSINHQKWIEIVYRTVMCQHPSTVQHDHAAALLQAHIGLYFSLSHTQPTISHLHALHEN